MNTYYSIIMPFQFTIFHPPHTMCEEDISVLLVEDKINKKSLKITLNIQAVGECTRCKPHEEDMATAALQYIFEQRLHNGRYYKDVNYHLASSGNGTGATSLYFAIANGYTKMYNLLISYGANPDLHCITSNLTIGKELFPVHTRPLISVAAENGRYEILKDLIEKRGGKKFLSFVTERGANVVTYASMGDSPNQMKIMKYLLDLGAHISSEGDDTPHNNAIIMSISEHNLDMLKLLLQYANPQDLHARTRVYNQDYLEVVNNCKAHTKDATKLRKLNEIEALIKDVIGLEFGDSLHNAVNSNDVQRVTALLQNPYMLKHKERLVNKYGVFGYTPIHFAATNGHKELVELLIQNDAYIDVKTKTTAESETVRTPLMLAISQSATDVALLLIKEDEDSRTINVKDEANNRPIDFAAMKGLLPVVKKLIDLGVKVEGGPRHTNALHYALYHGHIDVVEYLVDKVPDYSAVTTEGALTYKQMVIQAKDDLFEERDDYTKEQFVEQSANLDKVEEILKKAIETRTKTKFAIDLTKDRPTSKPASALPAPSYNPVSYTAKVEEQKAGKSPKSKKDKKDKDCAVM